MRSMGICWQYWRCFLVLCVALASVAGCVSQGAATEAQRCLALPAWAWAADRELWAIDANGLTSRPGPRVVDGIEALARLFNPDCFSPLDVQHARRLTP